MGWLAMCQQPALAGLFLHGQKRSPAKAGWRMVALGHHRLKPVAKRGDEERGGEKG
jgi:hypothetical protein